MPRVPQTTAEEMANPQNPITGDKFVAPENLLVAAAHMNDMGRLFEGGGGRFAGLKGVGSRAKPSKSLKVR